MAVYIPPPTRVDNVTLAEVNGVAQIKDGGVGLTQLGATAKLVKSGTYVGDGNAAQAIAGVGFQPVRLVIIRMSGTGTPLTLSFAAAAATEKNINLTGATQTSRTVDVVTALGADGFTVSNTDVVAGDGATGNDFNEAGVTYLYLAWQA